MAQPDYMKYITFRPGPDFKEQMERHWNDRAGDIPMRAITEYQCPDYDVLGGIPLCNYILWRKGLEKGDPERGCRGFWFSACPRWPIMDMDRSEVKRECILLSQEHRQLAHRPLEVPRRLPIDTRSEVRLPVDLPKGDPGNIASHRDPVLPSRTVHPSVVAKTDGGLSRRQPRCRQGHPVGELRTHRGGRLPRIQRNGHTQEYGKERITPSAHRVP